VKSNIDLAVPSPAVEQPTVQITASQLVAMTVSELEGHLQEWLDWSGFNRLPQQVSADRSPQVSSLIAVWLISQIGDAVGQKKLINLSKIENKESLRSIAGISKLLHRAIADQQLLKKAS